MAIPICKEMFKIYNHQNGSNEIGKERKMVERERERMNMSI